MSPPLDLNCLKGQVTLKLFFDMF